jgi:squalene-hopene/tetraprenyl-beta-curcumene cyclase
MSRPAEELGPLELFAEAVQTRQASDGERILGNSPNVNKELAKFLSEAQFQSDNGFKPTDPAYGGWGFDAPLAPGRPGHMDLAHTRRAMEALREAEQWNTRITPNDDHGPVQERLQCFLRVVQKHPRAAARPQLTVDGPTSTAPPPLFDSSSEFDGGFFFSPVVEAANKGRIDETPAPHWRSYATATCDGILALLAAGVPRDDERVTAAVAWLQRHTNLDYPQGVPTDYPEPWGAAIRFYHYAVRAEVYRALAWPSEQSEQLAAIVCERQEADGSFVNRESPLMKEDDPVMCTALATVALANCLT